MTKGFIPVAAGQPLDPRLSRDPGADDGRSPGRDRRMGHDLRLGREHAWPTRVPFEVARFGESGGVLPVGAPGKVGLLELDFARVAGRTELVRRFQKSPLHLMRPLYSDRSCPSTPVATIQATGGGIVQGDRLRLDISVAAGAHAIVTTQGATKVHGMDSGYATQLVNLRVAQSGLLEWMPDPTIPFAGSRLHQAMNIQVAEGGAAICAELVTGGRLGRGERWQMDALCLDLCISRPGRPPLQVDTLRLTREAAASPVVLGGAAAVGTVVVVTPERLATGSARAGGVPAILSSLRQVLTGIPGVRAGASTLSDGAGVWVRILSSDPEQARHAIDAVWDTARRALIEVPRPDLRKG